VHFSPQPSRRNDLEADTRGHAGGCTANDDGAGQLGLVNELLTVEEVARICGLSEWAIRRAIDDGELRASKLRSRWRVRPEDLEGWLEACLNQPPSHLCSVRGGSISRPGTAHARDSLRSLNETNAGLS
jgi:excisionase family DNA binding protein